MLPVTTVLLQRLRLPQVCARGGSRALNLGCIIDYCQYSLKWVDELLCRSAPPLLDIGSRIRQIDLTDRGLSMLELTLNHTQRLKVFNLQTLVSSLQLMCSRFFNNHRISSS
jgi:hypothetical protein